MIRITIDQTPGLSQWRHAARYGIANNIAPDHIIWSSGDAPQTDLFSSAPATFDMNAHTTTPLNVSKHFVELAEVVICHTDIKRFDILYRILWRLTFENKSLLHIKTDADIMAARKMSKAVCRDTYKIKAFLRFREIEKDGQSCFVAWYEPEHYTLKRVLPFFKTRFRNMNWFILTPYLSAHWHDKKISFHKNPRRDLIPDEDKFEDFWLTYYASIFNPARTKQKAMLTQMPKKYWKNMPETQLIDDMIKTSEARTKDMIQKSRT